jgi:hypothetical protein
MSQIFATHHEKAVAAFARGEAAVQRAERRLEQHDGQKPCDDGDALFQWRRDRRDLEDRLAVDREILGNLQARVDEARAKVEKQEADRRHAAAEKLANEHAKLTLEIAADAEKLAAKLSRHGEMLKAIKAANAERGERAAIVDGEFQVRSKPGETRPAVTIEDEVWVDAQGKFAPLQIYDKHGMLFKNPAVVGRGTIKQVLREACQEPPSMPERFAFSFELVYLEGRRLWTK